MNNAKNRPCSNGLKQPIKVVGLNGYRKKGHNYPPDVRVPEIGEEFESIAEASRELGITYKHISGAVNKHFPHARGIVFEKVYD